MDDKMLESLAGMFHTNEYALNAVLATIALELRKIRRMLDENRN